MDKFLPAFFIAMMLTIASCGGKTPTPGQVANAILVAILPR